MDNYEKLKQIGKGAYGVVWLVKSIKDKKNFVLKRIDLRKSLERDKKSAQQEAQLLKNLKHPNIVSYKESFQVDGFLHIVMCYCDGGDLYTKIKEQDGKFLEETQIVEWFVQIAMALQYMHEQNILHRDLKTQNIFLTKNKIIKVGDLGIARVLKSESDMATTIIGTPYYMSPELFLNQPYNSKSDVWALGCCVYEMTTLKHAFNAKDMTSLVLKITRGKMPAIPQHYSSDFISLIEAMLNADPKKRPSVFRILRHQFIKKNIMLFLERTKLKQAQAQHLEKENRLKYEQANPKPPVIEKSNKPTPRNNSYQNLRPKSAQELSDNNRNNDNNLRNRNDSPQRSVSSQSKLNEGNEVRKSNGSKPRVRISSVVENIETREYFKLHSLESTLKDFDNSSEEDEVVGGGAYELTKPMQKKIGNVNPSDSKYEPKTQIGWKQESKTQIGWKEEPKTQVSLKHQSNSPTEDQPLPHRPKMIGKSNPALPIQNRSVNSSSSQESSSIQTNFNARERRRQKLRLSQNESSSSELKPPILRRLEVKAQKSEIFYNSDNNKKNSSSISNSHQKHISKSCNDIDNQKNSRQLVDSLKIFRNINPVPGEISGTKNLNDSDKKQAEKQQNPFYPKINSSNSSSSSSIASSNDDDPGKKLIRVEKQKKRDIKELNTFIGHLTSTLNAANLLRCDSDIDDIKDEILEDLEEEAILAEESCRDDEDEENDISNQTIRNGRAGGSCDVGGLTINNLGATNHMYNRIRQLENEFINLLGEQKLEEAFRILDRYKEDEVKAKLIKLMGQSVFEANFNKLWLLKFCRDTAQISVR